MKQIQNAKFQKLKAHDDKTQPKCSVLCKEPSFPSYKEEQPLEHLKV